MASASTLPAAALQASKAALTSALAENEVKTPPANGDAPLEDGEIQEVDMQAQAETIRTVFNDPKNFNVKVRDDVGFPVDLPFLTGRASHHSIPYILRGPCGSIPRQPRVAIYRRPQCPPSHKRLCPRPQEGLPRKAGWRISSGSSVSTV